MGLVLIFLFMALFWARAFSAYDSRENNGRYIVIKNEKVARLIIRKEEITTKRDTPIKDRNKMSVFGLAFYLSIMVIALISLVLACSVDIPCDILQVNSENLKFSVDTLNEKIPIVLSLILLCLELLYFLLRHLKTIKEIEEKWGRILLATVMCVAIAIIGVGTLGLLTILFRF